MAPEELYQEHSGCEGGGVSCANCRCGEKAVVERIDVASVVARLREKQEQVAGRYPEWPQRTRDAMPAGLTMIESLSMAEALEAAQDMFSCALDEIDRLHTRYDVTDSI